MDFDLSNIDWSKVTSGVASKLPMGNPFASGDPLKCPGMSLAVDRGDVQVKSFDVATPTKDEPFQANVALSALSINGELKLDKNQDKPVQCNVIGGLFGGIEKSDHRRDSV